jgi:hypothetical protein
MGECLMVTRTEALLEIQVAAQARLTGDTTLMGMITGVFEEPIEGQALPYISYGQHVDGPFPTFGHVNHEGFFLLDIWSAASNKDECYAIRAEVRRLLVTTPQNPPLALPSYGFCGFTYDWSTIFKEEEFAIWHMPVRFMTRAVEM